MGARTRMWTLVGVVLSVLGTQRAHAIDEEHRARAMDMSARAIAYLRAQQDEQSGGWAHNPDGPNLPAISGLVVTGMILDPRIDASDPDVREGIAYILSFRQPDGGIYDRILPSYNTSICLSALSHALHDPGEDGPAFDPGVIESARDFLISLQYGEDATTSGEGGRTTQRVPPSHPFYGGIGYGSHGRPDNSNLNMMLQALHDSGLEGDHEAFQRALVFLQRTQMLDEVNDMPYADGSRQGGFIYATSPDGVRIGQGESKAGLIEETMDDGRKVSRLRAYGSMTYAGFKSYLYADLDRDDPRVRAAFDWIRRNYTLEENPGVGTDGLYYYFLTFARALDALGEDVIEIEAPDAPAAGDDEQASDGGEARVRRDWANDLIDRLSELQNDDGSFRSVDDRWMEDNPVLITAYSLIALEHAMR